MRTSLRLFGLSGLDKRRPLIVVTVAIVLVCIALMIAVPFYVTNELDDRRSRIDDDLEPMFVNLTNIDDDLLSAGLASSGLIADPSGAQAYEASRDELVSDLRDFRARRDSLNSENRELLDRTIVGIEAYLFDVADRVAALVAAGDSEAASAIQAELGAPRFFAADALIEESELAIRGEIEAQREDISELDDTGNIVLAVIGALALLSGGLVAALAFQVDRSATRETAVRSAAELDRERLNRIIDSMADGVALFDLQGMPVRVNGAAERMWGLRSDQIMELEVDELTNPNRLLDAEGNEMGHEKLPSTVAIRENREVKEMVMTIEKGATRTDILASAAPIRDDRGYVTGAVAVWHDVTELRSVERLKDEFLSFAAHELRTPLTIVKGYASTLSRRLTVEAEQDMARSINDESDRISALISQLLDVSRIEAGNLKLDIEVVKVRGVVDSVVSRHRDVDPGREFIVKDSADGVPCMADSEALKQILDNLLSNARKYSPATKPILVDVTSRDSNLEIAVTDQGVGIPADELDRIGDKLFRASTGRKREGSGLGLYIARRYLEQQNGRLEVASEVGKGSTFTAVLPCPDA